MKDNEAAAIALIKHITRRLDEFLYENTPGRFQTIEEMRRGFSRWLRLKETSPKVKHGNGVIAEEVFLEDVIGEQSATLAFVKLFDNGKVGVMWSPLLFAQESMMPDELREDLIELLRFHANKLEDRSLDTRMQECAGKQMGTA